ncbi:MAG: F-box protein [Gammaproteobacteria bacterium]|nr:F-box protein [Gammaproteobacteria bacterium]
MYVYFSMLIDGCCYQRVRALVAPIRDPELILGTQFMAQQLRSFTIVFTGEAGTKLQFARRFSPTLHKSLQVKHSESHSTVTVQDMPPEVLAYILQFLPPSVLGKCRRVCKNWFARLEGENLANYHPIRTLTLIKNTVYQSPIKQMVPMPQYIAALKLDGGETLHLSVQSTPEGNQQLTDTLRIILGRNLIELHLGELLPWKVSKGHQDPQRLLSAELVSSILALTAETLERLEAFELADPPIPLPMMPRLTHLNLRHYEMSSEDTNFFGTLSKCCPKLRCLTIGHLYCARWAQRQLSHSMQTGRALYEGLLANCPDLYHLNVHTIDCRAQIEFPIDPASTQTSMVVNRMHKLKLPVSPRQFEIVRSLQIGSGEYSSVRPQDHIIGNIMVIPSSRGQHINGHGFGQDRQPPLAVAKTLKPWTVSPTEQWIARADGILHARARNLQNMTREPRQAVTESPKSNTSTVDEQKAPTSSRPTTSTSSATPSYVAQPQGRQLLATSPTPGATSQPMTRETKARNEESIATKGRIHALSTAAGTPRSPRTNSPTQTTQGQPNTQSEEIVISVATRPPYATPFDSAHQTDTWIPSSIDPHQEVDGAHGVHQATPARSRDSSTSEEF